jgi:A/G-specific adenine glycosylase
MEFGATHCTPKNPFCQTCTFQMNCVAHQLQKVDKLPVKKGKTKIQNRYFNYLVVVSADGKTLLEKRTENGIWKNLYQFPLVENEEAPAVTISEVQALFQPHQIESLTLYNNKPIVHKLSHRHLHIQFWVVFTSALGESGILVNQIKNYPVPVVIQNFIEEFSF